MIPLAHINAISATYHEDVLFFFFFDTSENYDSISAE